ncbi:hypothetical protein AAFC00_002125 [Neodothiora populina]|uniref:Ubiquitin-like domain-containing protein n=1 Tax=Neodothiora populina TaxID=2781224 RepID=A0ABR3PGD1_9PEZI
MAHSQNPIVVDLVIRFTVSEEDLIIRIESAQTTSSLSVKQKIRRQASTAIAGKRLRLIFAGRFLPDTAALSKCITIPPPPPAHVNHDVQGKGKSPATASSTSQAPRVIVNCSVGDLLTPAELVAESEAAEAADAVLVEGSASATSDVSNGEGSASKTTTAPAPRGFDRLLSQGFNPAAVAEMRAQYLQILSYTRTPDTMPSGDELRVLEDRWLDNNDARGSGAAEGGNEANPEDGGLEDMLWGNIIGFFWPVAMVLWFREEGMWTQRRRISVLTGMLVNLTFGFLRIAT